MEKRAIGLSIFLVASVMLFLLAFGPDIATCLSMLIILMGLVFLGVRTGSASGSTGLESPVNTAAISKTVVELDSRARWRLKRPEEYELGFILLVVGVVMFIITAGITLLFR